jgi:Zn-dependent protease
MMTGHRWKVATIRGIPLYVSSSWIWIGLLYTWSMYAWLSGGGVELSEAVMLAVFASILFFGSVLVHEAAHAIAARALGLPVSGITLLFWGGATETKAHARGPGGEFVVSIVGPLATLLMAGVFWWIHVATDGVASAVFRYLGRISAIFALFNALPAFPLDGGRVLLAAVWGITHDRRKAMRVAGYSGIVMGTMFAVAALYSISRGSTWWLFLGYLAAVLIATGRGMDRRIALRDQLRSGKVADAMRPPPATVPADMALSQTLDHYLRGTDEAFPVVDQGRVLGTISMASARKVGAHDPTRPARDAVIPLVETPVVEPDEPLDEALEWLSGKDGLVLRNGSLVGALGPGDVERWYLRTVEGRTGDDVAGVVPGATGGVPPRPDL